MLSPVAGRVPRKKKKKTKAEVQEADEVKKLPDELVPSNRPGLSQNIQLLSR